MDDLEHLAAPPGTFALGGKTYPILPPTPGDMLREAVEMRRLANAAGSKDPVEIEARFCLPEGVRWRVWYHVNRSGTPLAREQADALVTEFNSGPVCHALDAALALPGAEEGKKAPPPTGTGG